MMVGLEWQSIETALSILTRQSRGDVRNLSMVAGLPGAQRPVRKSCGSFSATRTYVNRTVWQKH